MVAIHTYYSGLYSSMTITQYYECLQGSDRHDEALHPLWSLLEYNRTNSLTSQYLNNTRTRLQSLQ